MVYTSLRWIVASPMLLGGVDNQHADPAAFSTDSHAPNYADAQALAPEVHRLLPALAASPPHYAQQTERFAQPFAMPETGRVELTRAGDHDNILPSPFFGRPLSSLKRF